MDGGTKGGFGAHGLAPSAALAIILLFLSTAWAAEFRVEIAYFDLQGGPLTLSEKSPRPLPDGCLAQVLLQTDRAAGRQAFRQWLGDFTLNGGARLRTPGFFLSDDLISGRELPPCPLFVRVWNAAHPAQAAGYWDSPPYYVLPGFQQVSFLRSEWTYHAQEQGSEEPVMESASSSSGALLAGRHELLTACPNPFNSSARISLEVKDAGLVRLRVFDLQGRLTATLIDGPLNAGSHDLVFDGSPLPSGLYFLSFEQPAAPPVIRKLILMR